MSEDQKARVTRIAIERFNVQETLRNLACLNVFGMTLEKRKELAVEDAMLRAELLELEHEQRELEKELAPSATPS